MGLFSDLRTVTKLSREFSKDDNPAARMRQATEHVQLISMQNTLRSSGAVAQATVITIRDTGRQINLLPVMEVDLTVFPFGGAPYAATATTHGRAQLAMLAPGATVQIRYDPANPAVVAIG